MKINTRVGLKNLKGDFLKEGDENSDNMILGEILGGILVQGSSAKDPGKVFKLGMDFYNKETVDIKPEDVTLIKEVLKAPPAPGKPGFPTLITGQICLILDGDLAAETPPAKEEKPAPAAKKPTVPTTEVKAVKGKSTSKG